MSLEYRVGDVFDELAKIADGSIDLIVTSPPFLALRSYLPSDHPLKHREIGSEATPAAFIDTLLELSAEFGRVLAPHGSLCVELGDTYSGNERGSAVAEWNGPHHGSGFSTRPMPKRDRSSGWPLAKSLTGIPTLYPWSLAYGRNLLTGQPSPAGMWRIRNVIVWARPNPPVGALGDKFRPATSYITIACRGTKRYFDLDAVRGPLTERAERELALGGIASGESYHADANGNGYNDRTRLPADGGGAPPLDWHQDAELEDGDWLWKLPTQPYRGAHYATYPLELPTRLIKAMCPLKVCVTCGKPSERITEKSEEYAAFRATKLSVSKGNAGSPYDQGRGVTGTPLNDSYPKSSAASYDTVGWSDCGHNQWRTGRVLDPFAGSGTTLQAAQNVGRHATGIDLDPRNAALAQSRVGMFLEVTEP